MSYLKNNFGLELKSLALFRISLACIIGFAVFPIKGYFLVSATISTNSPTYDYTSDIRFLIWRAFTNHLPGRFFILQNLHIFNSSYVTYLIAIAVLLSSLSLAAGYRTRLTTWVCFCLCGIAYFHRLGQFSLISDIMLPTLFWGTFLPLGGAYSLDRAMNLSPHPLPRSVVSSATLALIVQQYLNYWVTDRSIWFFFLVDHDHPLAFFNHIFGVGIITGLLLLLVPIQHDICRRVAVFFFVGIHSIAFLFLGWPILLSILAIVIWLVFIPRSIWEAAESMIDTSERNGLMIYYDADCGFCKKVVHVLRTLLILPATPLLTAQSEPSVCQDMETHNSWVVVDWTQKRHFKFEAIAYIFSLSPLFHFLTPILRWSPLMASGTQFYELIANNRKRAGLFTKFLSFKAYSISTSSLENLMVGALLIAFVIINSHQGIIN